jgi:outer membrane receptor protein involved in Fe transport
MRPFLLLLGASALIPYAASAQTTPTTDSASPPQPGASPATPPPANPTPPAPARADADSQDEAIVVTGTRLEAAGASIRAGLGATDYAISNATIQALPGGDNQQLNQILLQTPGVSQDGFGQFHVRDDHANLQYRIDGIILPEGLAVFGQTLSPRLIDRFDLLTGALPAQYGLRTAGIVDMTTKKGFKNEGQLSLYGGSHGTLVPSIEYGGSSGSTNFYLSGEYRRNDVGIESVDASRNPLHDRTDQFHTFAFADHIIDEENRVSFIGGYSNQTFQIPNPRGLHPDGTFSVNGRTDFLSNDLNERQREQTAFGLASFLHSSGPLTFQVSLFTRYSTLDYYPDVVGELLFNGIAQRAAKRDLAVGGQIEGAYKLGNHTIRGGAIVSRDRGTSRTTTQVFPLDPVTGDQAGEPFPIVDNGAATEWTWSAYLQDEWRIAPQLTFNFGARFDRYHGYRAEQQLSPRANLVWTPGSGTTIHAGYARYFSPPPFENVATPTVAKYIGTSAEAPSGLLNTTPLAERQNYFDVGIQQKIGRFTVGVDGYYRRSRNLIDEGQFGAPIVLTPFNYRDGRIKGIEGNVSYAHGPWLAYANLAWAKGQGRDIVSSQFNFDPGDLAYIRNHYIYLDHDQTWTGSGGMAYRFEHGALAGTKLAADLIYGSGLRTTPDNAPPNSAHLPGYVQVNASISHRFETAGLELRVDVVNLFDKVYEIRNGSGVGVGAPQFGPRRGFFVGVTKGF